MFKSVRHLDDDALVDGIAFALLRVISCFASGSQSLYARPRSNGRNQVLISSSDYHSHNRRELHSCQLPALPHC
jgi:hypothetical protein